MIKKHLMILLTLFFVSSFHLHAEERKKGIITEAFEPLVQMFSQFAAGYMTAEFFEANNAFLRAEVDKLLARVPMLQIGSQNKKFITFVYWEKLAQRAHFAHSLVTFGRYFSMFMIPRMLHKSMGQRGNSWRNHGAYLAGCTSYEVYRKNLGEMLGVMMGRSFWQDLKASIY